MTTGSESGRQRRETITRFFDAIQAGDYPALLEVLHPDAVTFWPQSSERITSAMACVRIYEHYPGGSPRYRVERISGAEDVWVAELVGDYGGDDPWRVVSIIEFNGARIARMTDYFGPTLPAPEWRRQWVDREDATT